MGNNIKVNKKEHNDNNKLDTQSSMKKDNIAQVDSVPDVNIPKSKRINMILREMELDAEYQSTRMCDP